MPDKQWDKLIALPVYNQKKKYNSIPQCLKKYIHQYIAIVLILIAQMISDLYCYECDM